MEKVIPILDNDRKHVKVYEMYIATKKNRLQDLKLYWKGIVILVNFRMIVIIYLLLIL